jgi:hypothetical protein
MFSGVTDRSPLLGVTDRSPLSGVTKKRNGPALECRGRSGGICRRYF